MKKKIIVKDIPKLVKNKKGRFIKYKKKKIPVKSKRSDKSLLKYINNLFKKYLSAKIKPAGNAPQPEQSAKYEIPPHPNKATFLDYVRLNNPKLIDDKRLLEYKKEVETDKKATDLAIKALEKDIVEQEKKNLDQKLENMVLKNTISQGQMYLQQLALQNQNNPRSPFVVEPADSFSTPSRPKSSKKSKKIVPADDPNDPSYYFSRARQALPVAVDTPVRKKKPKTKTPAKVPEVFEDAIDVPNEDEDYVDISNAIEQLQFPDDNLPKTPKSKKKKSKAPSAPKKITTRSESPPPALTQEQLDAKLQEDLNELKNKKDVIMTFAQKQPIDQLKQMWVDITGTQPKKGFNTKNGPTQIVNKIVENDLIDTVFYKITLDDTDRSDQSAPLVAQGIAPNPQIYFDNAGIQPPPNVASPEPSEQPNEENSGNGSSNSQGGLYNTEINKYMKDFPQFKGVTPIDKIDQYIVPNKNDQMFGFVMNTEPAHIPVGHWVAVLVTGDTIEYFDPLAQSPPPSFNKEIKKLVSKHFGKGKIYQLKINYVKTQNDRSNTCGYHSCKFLKDRFTGQTWKQASKFKIIEDSVKGEANIKKFKQEVKQFDTMKF